MKVQVGDPSINWFDIKPQSDEKEVFLIEAGNTRSVGMTFEEIVLVEVLGKPAFRRSQTLKSDVIGNRTAETVVFRDTFHPHGHVDISNDHKIKIVYQEGKVTGEKKLASGEVIPINVSIQSGVFDSHSIEMVLRLLPLKEDYAAVLPIFHAVQGIEMTVSVNVLGSEIINTPQGDIDTWKVQTEWNGLLQNYWISFDNEDLVKQSTIISDDVQLEFDRV